MRIHFVGNPALVLRYVYQILQSSVTFLLWYFFIRNRLELLLKMSAIVDFFLSTSFHQSFSWNFALIKLNYEWSNLCSLIKSIVWVRTLFLKRLLWFWPSILFFHILFSRYYTFNSFNSEPESQKDLSSGLVIRRIKYSDLIIVRFQILWESFFCYV